MGHIKVDDGKDEVGTVESRKHWIEKQNLEIRDRLQPPLCVSSLSTLTGLSVGSRASRTCELIRTGRTGISCRRATPSILLEHGFDWISNEDQRILNAMVMRREAQIEEEDLSLSARNIWEKDRILYNKMLNEKQQQRIEYLQEKRRIEKEELERRKENISHAIKCQQAEIEERMNERHLQCEIRHKQILTKKRLMLGNSGAEELFNRMRKEELSEGEILRNNLHIDEVQAKEMRAMRNLYNIMEHRNRKLKESSCKREKRMEAAQQLREALNQRFEEWCEESKRLLNNKLCLCQLKASKAIEWKRKTTHDSNQMKRLQHSNALSLIREEDRFREFQARQELLKKDMKMKDLRERKEQAKARSRSNALTTANLRQQIKTSYPLHS